MGTVTLEPTAATITGGPSECAECHHPREGFAASVRVNKRLMRVGKPLQAPTCNSGYDAGYGDVHGCECSDASHAETLATEHNYL